MGVKCKTFIVAVTFVVLVADPVEVLSAKHGRAIEFQMIEILFILFS